VRTNNALKVSRPFLISVGILGGLWFGASKRVSDRYDAQQQEEVRTRYFGFFFLFSFQAFYFFMSFKLTVPTNNHAFSVLLAF
jgi:hypothetical protein